MSAVPHALVTGAASGLGRAIAQELAENAWQLTLVDLQDGALTTTAEHIRETTGAEVDTVVADLGVDGSASEVVERTWDRAPIDGLVNAAGIYPAIPFFELDAAAWDRVQHVNVSAPLFATQTLARRAIADGRTPAVVNIASGAARRARPGAAHYSTSKAALVMVTQASAVELGAHGIRVNAISPGFFAVDSVVNPVTPEYTRLLSETVLPGPADPRAIGATARFLLGDGARWISGAVVPVDGGAVAGTSALPAHWTGTTVWQLPDTHPLLARKETAS
ncbi:MAG: SDR family oxidoreductase [Microbacterium sp.]